MTIRPLFAGLLLLLSVAGCKQTKHTTPSVAPKPEKADSTSTSALPYRESNPRSNDLIHTSLDVSFDWDKSRLNGRASLLLTPYFHPTDRLYLDARGMDINRLEVYHATGNPTPVKDPKAPIPKQGERVAAASFTYENDSLKINLGKTFKAGECYFVVIDYVAKPNEIKAGGSQAITEDKGLYFINPTGENHFKMPQIWTQGETQSSSAWFPTIDSPNEKMTQEIYMTVHDKFTTLSNGVLTDTKKNADGTRTDHWVLMQPHAPYLVMMAVGEFVKITDEPWKNVEISYYVEKAYAPHAKAIFGDTREMIEFYSSKLGVPYAWPKYAQIAVRDYVSGAMENTSATLHGDFMVYQTERETLDEKKGTGVIAHELFHQWFGDLVTCESWSNLPLNESFATYGEYLWEEHKNGRDAADYHHYQSRQGYLHADAEKEVVRYHYKDREDMFDAFSYNKGGQILHMLRKAVGDEAFFASLKNYLTANQYKPVEIHHLRLAFEETTGRDLNWFFNQWFLSKGRPKLKVESTHANGFVELRVKQLQDLKTLPLYRLPLEVDLYSEGKKTRHHIEITQQDQTFRIAAPVKPLLVNFDAERQLLCDLEYTKSTDEYVFQYRNAPLYDDRSEALKKTDSLLTDDKVFAMYRDAALSDRLYGLRNRAMSVMAKAPATRSVEVRNTMIQVYNTDKNSICRAHALQLLNRKYPGDREIMVLNEKGLSDMSYAVCGEALDGIAKADVAAGLQKAKAFEKEPGKDLIYRIAGFYGEHGSDEQIAFFHNALQWMNGFEVLPFISSYVKTARRCQLSESAIAAAMDLEMLGKGSARYTKYATLKGMKDLVAVWEDRERKSKVALEAATKEGKSTPAMEAEARKTSETKEILTKMYNRSK